MFLTQKILVQFRVPFVFALFRLRTETLSGLIGLKPRAATQVWRRANKKIRGEAVAKRRTRKGGKVQKAIVGISLEEIKQRRAAKPDPTKVRCRPTFQIGRGTIFSTTRIY